MSFFSENFLKQFDFDGGGGGGWLGIIGGGPSSWAGGGSMWSGIGSRIDYEVNLTGIFGASGGGSLAERAAAAEAADEIIVYGPSSQGDGAGVTVHDLGNGMIYDIWDGGGSDWRIFEREAPNGWEPDPNDPAPPLPPTRYADADGYQADSDVHVHVQNGWNWRNGSYDDFDIA